MDRPTKALIIGILAGVLVVGAGFLNVTRLERGVDRLSTQCRSQAQREKEVPNPPGWGGVLVCDAPTLVQLEGQHAHPGIQGEIVAAHQKLVRAKQWPVPIGLAIAVALTLPWAWYFLLNRIRELRNAVR